MSQPHESDHNVALVLGGGGAAGNAWATRIPAGLAGFAQGKQEATRVTIL